MSEFKAECYCESAGLWKVLKRDEVVRMGLSESEAKLAAGALNGSGDSEPIAQLLKDSNAVLAEILKALSPYKFAPDGTPAPSPPPPPPRTTGQRIAERMVQFDGSEKAVCVSHPNRATYLVLDGSDPATADTLRPMIAAAIDKAIADDRAETHKINAGVIAAEREACAKIADDLLLCIDCDHHAARGIEAVRRGIADRIRARP